MDEIHVPLVDTGYAPIVEARYYSGSVVYDDYVQLRNRARNPPQVYFQNTVSVRVQSSYFGIQGVFEGGQAIYVVYNQPIA